MKGQWTGIEMPRSAVCGVLAVIALYLAGAIWWTGSPRTPANNQRPRADLTGAVSLSR